MKHVIYYFGLVQGLLLQVFLFKTKTYYEDDSKQNKRIKGNAILITNHRSFVDGVVIALRFFSRRLYFIIADFTEYYAEKETPLKRFLLSVAKVFATILGGGIFIDRKGHSLSFIEKCKRMTGRGKVIVIFPEGDYRYTYEPVKFSPGYVIIAIETGAQIIPVVNDFNYGLFKRVHLMVGNRIDLSKYSPSDLTKAQILEINDEIYHQFLILFYKLKKRKAERFSPTYEFVSPKKGDVIRVRVASYYHYGVYLNDNEVIQFGNGVISGGEMAKVHAVSLNRFCSDKIPEVRTLKRNEQRFVRKEADIERYAKSCLGQGGYQVEYNNCLDFVNRVTLKI